MSVDVQAETVVRRPRPDVAGFVMDANNDTRWIGGITQARVLTDGPTGVGTRAERVAHFLGRRIEYVNEVTEYAPPSTLVMKSVKGPFPMRITYSFDERDGGTLARIRVEGDAGGFYKLAGPMLARQVKKGITRDLANLKRLMESGS